MKIERELTIIEQVRAWKEEIAAEHDFDIKRIIASANTREEASGERVLDPPTRTKESKQEICDFNTQVKLL